MKTLILPLLFSLLCVEAVSAQTRTSNEATLDTFGIQKLYPTKSGTFQWNSAHWGNGIARGIDWDGDQYDPTGYTENHSAGDASPFFKIDGSGVMQMMSSGPRFHINSLSSGAAQKQFFRDVEFTAYYRRGEASVGSGEKDYGGMVMGVRSGPLGHSSSGGNDCDASTYYARIRHDGKWDFEKEWKHPASYYQSMGVIGKQTPLWGGNRLEANRWIGMKFVAYNLDDNSVKLELYIDSISGGNFSSGNVSASGSNVKWELVGTAIDAGQNWSGAGNGVANVEGCESYNGLTDAYAPILEGHGTALMRTDGITNNVVQAEYKYVSLREIDPTAKFSDGSDSPADTSGTSTDPNNPNDPASISSPSRHLNSVSPLPAKQSKDALGRNLKENSKPKNYWKVK